ncbi:hypothetical protein K503DRAFT_454028 [Rhizopogon vinicolor AM-OR11-026]|uniref:Major facilitator superfamily (MFS) profile domain-containing protein n=1 Tax=Rhizopogon vinicolor AM-OR11-026 TaxID=1314800 RepID=A0A1B7MP26_9AGAM|nr:hypothetical protein K503DRAFT_454028 [Rhizopogon vinicolor AM-OR11-026]
MSTIYDVQRSDMTDETSSILRKTSPKKQKTSLPKLQIGILMLVQMAELILSMSIYPYINQLIRELDITGGNDAAVGYYAGIISLFFITESLQVLGWSRLSDRIGRKPVLMLVYLKLVSQCFALVFQPPSGLWWSGRSVSFVLRMTSSHSMGQITVASVKC